MENDKQWSLLAITFLRTVHESFPSHDSSLSKAFCVVQLSLSNTDIAAA
ncbi:hypothetical protein [Caedibacter taeniospiralis]|nr:hypothetical protein [Caedibacter taeniospiralis]